jgi:prepilin-type N-terminal cleavage/methylation domain-containing protein
MQKIRNMKGFTLVEVAIVLVIVGLVIFGVLKGQEMVKQGKVKKLMNQKNDLAAAVFTYQDKRGGKLPGATNPATPSRIIALSAWKDLSEANLISGTYTVAPLASIADAMKNPYGGSVDVYYTAMVDTKSKNVIEMIGVPVEVMHQIDIAYDDGTDNGTPADFTDDTGGNTGGIQWVDATETLQFAME